MNLTRVKYLYLKELREILRNWGLIILLVFFPLIVYPTSLIFMAEFGASQQKKLQKQKTHLAIAGSQFAPELITLLKDNKELDIVFDEAPSKSTVPEKHKAIIMIPSNFGEINDRSTTINVDIYYDSTDDESSLARLRVEEVLNDYQKELMYRRLESQKLERSFLEPLGLNFENVASKNKIAGQRLGEVLPLILVMFIMLGTIQVAVDITAGEKERKTIQTLILSPLSRLEIVTSKLLVVLSTTLFTTAINFMSVGFTVFFVYKLTEKVQGLSISFASIGLSLLISIPLVVLISALFLLVGLMAKNQLEANIYILPILFIGLLPAGLPSIPGLKYDTWIALVPIANTALTVKTIFLGTYTLTSLVMTFLSNSFYAVLIMLLVSKLFQKEDIAFGGLSDLIFVKKDKNTPAPGESILFFLATLSIYFFIGSELQQKNLKVGLVASQLLLLLLPAIYFIKRGNYDPRKILKLNNPGIIAILAAPFIGWATIVISQFYERFQSSFLHVPKEINEFMITLISYNNWKEGIIVFLIIAVTPSIIEEIAFRGVILSGFERSMSRVSVCLLVGFLFSLFHLNLYILVPVTIMGALLTYCVIKTNSIITGMLIHLSINGTQVVMANVVPGEFTLPPYAFFISLIILAGGLYLLPERGKIVTKEVAHGAAGD